MIRDIPDKEKILFEKPDDQGLFGATFFAFNTVIRLRAFFSLEHNKDAEDAAAQNLVQTLVSLCRRYEWLLSRTLDKSDIFRLNNAQGFAVKIDRDTWEALDQGLRYSSQSKGHFDITMGSVTHLWDFAGQRIPENAEIEQALTHVDWQKVKLSRKEQDEEGYFARLLDSSAMIDLGGTAKGFIADKMCKLMQEQGVNGAFVNLGGNVAVFGAKPDGSSWRIGIQSPFDPDKIRGAISLFTGSVVTSGLYERCFTHNGKLYHHILDVKTGFPVCSDIAGVSVVAASSADADGYSTTLFALGTKKAIEFVEELDDIEVIIIDKSGEIITSSGLLNFIPL